MAEKTNNDWLPHFSPEMAGGARGNILSSFCIALEAWRRGLKVVIHDRRMRRYTIGSERPSWRNGINFIINRVKKSPRFSIGPNKRSYTFRSSQVIDHFFKPTKFICDNKDLAKDCLSKAKVPVPKGKRFNSNIPEKDIIKYALNHFSFPLVIKPAAASLGRGVFVNIENRETLERLLAHVRKELGYKDVIVEEHVYGEDYRVFVLGGKALSVVKRIPANITGDGKRRVGELIEEKNRLRKANPYLARGLIKVDREVLDCLHRAGYSIDSVPKKGELLFLRGISNLSAGGDSIDVTNEAPQMLKDLAVRAVKAVPHLHSCGVDVLFHKTEDGKEHGVVVELNYLAHLGLHLFPVKGKARDVAGAIVDYYFPESARRKGNGNQLYFKFRALRQYFANGAIAGLTLPQIPPGRIRYRRLELKGMVPEDTKNRLRKKALQLNLFGHSRDLKNGNVRVVLAGKKKDIDAFKSFLSTEMKVEIVKETGWKRPVAAGFYIY
jgi:cyanophycin synthetase